MTETPSLATKEHPGPPAPAVSRRGRRATDLRTPLFVLLVAFLLWQVAAPLLMLVWGSISSADVGDPAFFSLHSLTLDNFSRAFSGGDFGSAFGNTAVFAVGATVVAFLFGTFLAWVTERTDAPFRKIIIGLVIARFIVPDILTTAAWTFLGSPRIGSINSWLDSLFGSHAPTLNIYSMPGMIWVAALDFFPLAFLLMSAAFRSMDPSLEEASLISGASAVFTTLRITVPLALPAILATFILLITRGITTFETPIMLGLPAKINTFVVEIYRKTAQIPSDLGSASVFAMLVLVICLAMITVNAILTRRSEAFAVVGGKAFRPRRLELGRARYLASAAALLILFCSIVLPMLMLVWVSLLPSYSSVEPMTFKSIADRFPDLTLVNFRAIFDSDVTVRAFRNSAILSISAATIVVLLMAATAWITVKSRIRGRKVLDQLVFAPIAVPALLFGLAFLWLYLVVPIPIYGTLWILLLAYIAHFMPQAFRIISASVTQISDQLEEAAQVSGATWFQTFRTILLPLLVPGLLAAWIFVTVLAFREFPASIMLYSNGSEVVGVSIFNLWQEGSLGLLSAFGIVMLLFLLILLSLGALVAGRFGLRQRIRDGISQ